MIRTHVRSKDISGLPANLPCIDILSQLTTHVGNVAHVLPVLQQLPLPLKAKALVENLAQIVQHVAMHAPQATLTIDALDSRGFDYHHGVCYAFYLPAIQQEIGRGGFYTITREDGSTLPAAGSTLYVTRLRLAHIGYQRMMRVYIPADVSITHSRTLREQGYATVHGNATGQEALSDAKRLGLDAIFINEHIQKL